MNPIILISTCKADRARGYHAVIRSTWGKAAHIPYIFCLGDAEDLGTNEISLDCPDNYFSLSLKTALSVRWALQQGFTHTFRAFTDTYIDTGRLWQSGFEEHEYIGNLCGFSWNGFMHGGPGYWLGPTASQTVADGYPQHEKFEDQWVGNMMRKHNVTFTPDFRYSMGRSYKRRERQVLPDNDIISEHLSNSGFFHGKEQYHPLLMQDRHAARYK